MCTTKKHPEVAQSLPQMTMIDKISRYKWQNDHKLQDVKRYNSNVNFYLPFNKELNVPVRNGTFLQILEQDNIDS